MATKIHHGPPGSYKTAGAVMDDLIAAVLAGRAIVTNVRGVTRERCLEALPDTPESLEIIHVDTSTAEGRERLARWFHWVPHGALLLIDEAQSVWPKRWGKSDIEALDYPGGVDAASAANRPHDWATAWEMHRHYNWDVVLTTPSIKLIRGDIRECADMAYKHRNMASIGISGRYLEAVHPADSNGARSDFIGDPKIKKIKPEVWNLYESTATGAHSDGFGGIKFWKDVRLLVAVGVLALAIVAGVWVWPDSGILASGDSGDVGQSAAASGTPVPRAAGGARGRDGVGSARVEYRASSAGVVSHPLHSARIVLDGEMDFAGYKTELVFRVQPPGAASWVATTSMLRRMGYAVRQLGPCVTELKWSAWREWVICAPEQEKEGPRVVQVGFGD